MEFLSGLWTYVIPFLVVLTVLVFVHELGHYWVARRNGVRIETFSIGFGPELFGRPTGPVPAGSSAPSRLAATSRCSAMRMPPAPPAALSVI